MRKKGVKMILNEFYLTTSGENRYEIQTDKFRFSYK